MRKFTCWLLLATMPASWALPAAAAGKADEQKRALHALNRLAFGPRPGEVERVAALGVEQWIERQLHPQRVDDAALEARLKSYRTLAMDTRELIENYPPPQLLRAVAEGRQPMPSDPERRAVYEAQLARYRARQQRGQNDNNEMNEMPAAERAERRQARQEALALMDDMADMTADERFAALMKMSDQQRRALVAGIPQEQRQRLFSEFSPEQRSRLLALVNPQLVIAAELQQAKVLRAVHSERQLEEVMTDFWFNHFNVFIAKGADRFLVTGYERDAIRPHAFGKFKDLLVATAQHPAMLFYLDNWTSVGPKSEAAVRGPEQMERLQRMQRRRGRFGGQRRQPQMSDQEMQERLQQAQRMRRGLNENYARELMELHTLGVDGGYTQQDVTEVARVFTGWTIRQPRRGGGYQFNPRMHEPGDKVVLGKKIEEAGEKEGVRVLEMLARHPATARFISTKLAQRFVADEPPKALVERMAQTFLKTDGDIREVLRTLFRAPEFWAPEAYRAKVKTPLEFVASAVRATGAEVRDPMPLVQALNRLGMPLYAMQPPTGYAMKAEAWVNSTALINRLNFALALGAGRLRGIELDAKKVLPASGQQDVESQLAALEQALLAGDVSPQTHATIKQQLNSPQVSGRALDDPERPVQVGVLAGLILGSPEFQRR